MRNNLRPIRLFPRLTVNMFGLLLILSLPNLVLAQEFEYVGKEYNPGPLASMYDTYFDWADRTLIADFNGAMDVGGLARADGVVKYQSRDGATFYVLN